MTKYLSDDISAARLQMDAVSIQQLLDWTRIGLQDFAEILAENPGYVVPKVSMKRYSMYVAEVQKRLK